MPSGSAAADTASNAVNARFSSLPRRGTCFDPRGAYVILDPGIRCSLIVHARRRNTVSHCSSASTGSFCAALNESETRKYDPSLKQCSNSSDACSRIMTMMMQRTVAKDIGAPAARKSLSCDIMFSTTSGMPRRPPLLWPGMLPFSARLKTAGFHRLNPPTCSIHPMTLPNNIGVTPSDLPLRSHDRRPCKRCSPIDIFCELSENPFYLFPPNLRIFFLCHSYSSPFSKSQVRIGGSQVTAE